MSSLTTNYSHPATGSDTTFGTSCPLMLVLISKQSQPKTFCGMPSNTSEAYSDTCRRDEQTLSLGLMALVPKHDDLSSQDVTFYLNLEVVNSTNIYQLKEYIETQLLNHWYRIIPKLTMGTLYNIPSMVTSVQLRGRGVPSDIGDLTQYHDRSGMSYQEETPTTRLKEVHSTVTYLIVIVMILFLTSEPTPIKVMICPLMETSNPTFL